MLGCRSRAEMAVSMMAIFSRLAAPLMPAGNSMRLTATSVPFHQARYTMPNVPSPSTLSSTKSSCALRVVPPWCSARTARAALSNC
ncbi:MAG: hypothetical protein J3K34DRAFT_421061, partial [Monoraphidium minutum]